MKFPTIWNVPLPLLFIYLFICMFVYLSIHLLISLLVFRFTAFKKFCKCFLSQQPMNLRWLLYANRWRVNLAKVYIPIWTCYLRTIFSLHCDRSEWDLNCFYFKFSLSCWCLWWIFKATRRVFLLEDWLLSINPCL